MRESRVRVSPGSHTVRWCNGSTRVFGALCIGSNPIRTTNAILTQLVEYDTFNIGVVGSSPAGRTIPSVA